MPNPQKLGRLAVVYYWAVALSDTPNAGVEYDTTQLDTAILGDTDWKKLCVVDLTIARPRANTTLIDRCSPDDNQYIPGRRDTTITINMNEKRLGIEFAKVWHQIADTPLTQALLILNSDIADTLASGTVGNFITGDTTQTQPSEGAIVNAITLQPASLVNPDYVLKRVYGGGVDVG